MPRPADTIVFVAQVNGIVGVAFAHHQVGAFKVEVGKDFAVHTKQDTFWAEGAVFRCQWFGEAIFSDAFDVHDDECFRNGCQLLMGKRKPQKAATKCWNRYGFSSPTTVMMSKR